MELLNQPIDGKLIDRLRKEMSSTDYDTLNIIVAFAKNSGVLLLKDALDNFRKRGGKVNVYVGIDQDGTSYDALSTLFRHVDSLYIIHSEIQQTFHPKIYDFLGSDRGLVIVGSNNLTGGGLWRNFESSVILPSDSSDDLQESITQYIGKLSSLGNSFMQIKTQDGIDTLLENGDICEEALQRVHRSAERKSHNHKRLFGNGAPVKAPRRTVQTLENLYGSSPKQSTVSLSPSATFADQDASEEPMMWIETGRMTGGSRNILDLSKTSLIDETRTFSEQGEQQYIDGGVAFFGVDPNDTTNARDITIDFEGIDYIGNTIKFTPGNGTWRLQIKGRDIKDRKITNVLQMKGGAEYLVNKIVVFTKHKDDYYSMSVFPHTSKSKFRQASKVLAYNGRTSKSRAIGLLS